MQNVEFFREQLSEGSHGDVHIALQTPKQVRGPLVACGKPKEGMRKLGTPFRKWTEVMCPECSQVLEE